MDKKNIGNSMTLEQLREMDGKPALRNVRESNDTGSVGRAGKAAKGVIEMTREQYLAEIRRISKMVDREEIDMFECAILLEKALLKRQAYLKKHPEVKTRPAGGDGVLPRPGLLHLPVSGLHGGVRASAQGSPRPATGRARERAKRKGD